MSHNNIKVNNHNFILPQLGEKLTYANQYYFPAVPQIDNHLISDKEWHLPSDIAQKYLTCIFKVKKLK